MIVVDASVLAPALADDGADGEVARTRLRGETLTAPELVDLEVASVYRGLVLAGKLPLARAEQALADLVALPLQRAPHRLLLARCWSMRDDATIYDGSYVALAESLGVTLVTADARLAGATGLRCTVEVLSHEGPPAVKTPVVERHVRPITAMSREASGAGICWGCPARGTTPGLDGRRQDRRRRRPGGRR